MSLTPEQYERLTKIRNYYITQRANANIVLSRLDVAFLLSLILTPPQDERDPSVDYRIYEGDDQREIKGY